MAKNSAKPDTSAVQMPGWMHKLSEYRGLFVPIGFILLLAVILVPLPTWLMDILISVNISLAVVMLLTTIHMERALDFSVFPSLLLATTLFRLVLNIASTRLILSTEASSPEGAMYAAGRVIQSFSTFVAGQSLFVGIVIFLILLVVQFVVITKGATRISEVAARFTLDAMPGKQMAIDSDLNAGLIDENEARQRREEIRQEADFFGAMDGASKFVRGDAIAGIIITLVNVLGGFAVGALERGWPAAQTAEVFTRLTIGDGLTSQIPSFIISVAAALIVTRSSSKSQLSDAMADQLISQPKGLAITGAFLCLMSLSPLPTIPLLAMSCAMFFAAWSIARRNSQKASEAMQRVSDAKEVVPTAAPIESLLKVDTLELEVGYNLVRLVDVKAGGTLLSRVDAIRRQLAHEYGFVMPPIRIRDNMQLPTGAYRVNIRGNTVASSELRHDKYLAMDSGVASGRIDGEKTKEPAFGLDAWWIDDRDRARAESLDYTVVDPTSVLATHLTEVVKKHASELVTRDEVGNLIEGLKAKAPKLVEEAIPHKVLVSDLHRVLQRLLDEHVPIRDLEMIVETMADWSSKTKDIDVLTEYVRNSLRRTICRQHAVVNQDDGTLRLACVTLDPALEDMIAGYIERTGAGTNVSMPASTATRIASAIADGLKPLVSAGHAAVVMTSPSVRAVVRQLMASRIPGINVLAYNEIDTNVQLETKKLISLDTGAVVPEVRVGQRQPRAA